MTDRKKYGAQPWQCSLEECKHLSQHRLPSPWVGIVLLMADTKAESSQHATNGHVVILSKPRSYSMYSWALTGAFVTCYLTTQISCCSATHSPPILCQHVLGKYINLLLIIAVPQTMEQTEGTWLYQSQVLSILIYLPLWCCVSFP